MKCIDCGQLTSEALVASELCDDCHRLAVALLGSADDRIRQLTPAQEG